MPPDKWLLVDTSLAQRLNNLGPVNKATAWGICTTERLATLNDSVVARQVILRHTAERAAA